MKHDLVSACLLGVKCRYDGSHALNRALAKSLRNKSVLMVCPEKLGGLPTPRPPANLDCPIRSAWSLSRSKRDVHNGKRDVTEAFIKGARKVTQLLPLLNIRRAYLKARSPSCGYGMVYCKSLPHGKPVLTKGNGILADLLKRHKVRIKSV